MSEPKIEQVAGNAKTVRMCRMIGVIGAVLIVSGFAWMSYVIRGEVSVLILLAAAFAGGFHLLGCEILARGYAPKGGDNPDA